MNDGEIQSWRDACPPRNPLPTSSLHAAAQGQEMNDNMQPEGSAGTESTASGVCRTRCDSDMIKAQKQPTIFVSIASFRDSECQHTVRGRMTVVCGKKTCSVSGNWRAQSTCLHMGFPPALQILPILNHDLTINPAPIFVSPSTSCSPSAPDTRPLRPSRTSRIRVCRRLLAGTIAVAHCICVMLSEREREGGRERERQGEKERDRDRQREKELDRHKQTQIDRKRERESE